MSTEVMPQEAQEEAALCVGLQDMLYKINDENLQETANMISSSIFSSEATRVAMLVDSLFVAATYRPKTIPLYAKLVSLLMQKADGSNSLDKLKPIFLRQITRSADDDEFFMNKVPLFYYWQQCYTNGAFTFSDISEHLKKWLNDKTLSPNQILLLYIYFLPDIEKSEDKEMTEALKKLVITKKTDGFINDSLLPVAGLLNKLKDDDWKIYKEIINYGCLRNSLEYVLKFDKVDELDQHIKIAKSSTKGWDANQVIKFFPLEPSTFARNDLTLLQYCAFFGSEKCFNFLLENGADIKMTFNKKRTILDYAIDGLNKNIFETVIKEDFPLIMSLKTAAQFRNYDAFEYIYNKCKSDDESFKLSMKHVMKICAKSGNFRTLVYCMKNGHDPNEKYKDGLMLPHFAAIHGHTGILHFLVSYDKVDENCVAQWIPSLFT